MDPKIQQVSDGLSEFIIRSKYSRWIEDKERRESWEEAVDRVLDMHLRKFKHLPKQDLDQIKWAFDLVKDKRVMPSMRTMQFGGKAVEAHNARAYNCCVRHIDSIRAFAELGYLMLCGTGTGIGLSNYFLGRLPDLVEYDEEKDSPILTYTVEDTIEGWADSLEALISCYLKNTAFSGREIIFDYTKIRKKGSLLKIGGGKAPGYKPLKKAHVRIKKLLEYIIRDKKQQKLKTINAYDIMMNFADAVLSGGVRRTASSVIFMPDDEDMLNAKTYFEVQKFRTSIDKETNVEHCRVWVNGKYYDVNFDLNKERDKFEYEDLINNKRISWLHIEPQRARSNNSVLLLRDKCTKEQFETIVGKIRQWGEPGFVFADDVRTLFNPCFEIGFLPVIENVCGVQFCNLTSSNGAKIKSREEFKECVIAQTIIGTCQATYTDFLYLSKTAQILTEQEALLGNSIIGVLDSPEILLDENLLQEMATLSVKVNEEWAAKLGINKAARACCIKPDGTCSLAVGASSGCHPHHSRKYFKRVQTNIDENIYKFFKQQNPHMCEDSVWNTNAKDEVITFPIVAPGNAITKSQITAIEHLEISKKLIENWIRPAQVNNQKPISHNVSITVVVKDDEWDKVIDFIFDNRNTFAAVSFISFSGDKDYPQAPFEAVVTKEDEEKFDFLISNYSPVEYNKLKEKEDGTIHSAEAACAGGACSI